MHTPKIFTISRIERDATSSMHTSHSHSQCELYFLIKGACNMLIGQTNYTLTPGMFVIIPSGVPHRTTYSRQTASERLSIDFSADYIYDITDEFGDIWMNRFFFQRPMYLPSELQEDFLRMTGRLQHDPWSDVLSHNSYEWQQPADMFTDCIRKLHFQELIIWLLCNNTRNDYVVADAIRISDISVSEAVKYIDANYNEPLTLNGMAAMYQLNPSYFSARFKAINGVGFKEYLNNVRIIHAEKLLLETNKSITEIASECGYETSNYFGDTFRRIDHCSPSYFRKMRGNV